MTPDTGNQKPSLKLQTARTVKWNAIDRIATQLLYAVVGVILANILSEEDFGLVGVLLIFQAFAIIFVDSGFGAALLQKKNPTQTDYSTVFWFNLSVSIIIYIILFLAAPLIADIFHGGSELISLSRVMFLCFIFNGLGIIQTNRLMKEMNVKQIAVADVIALTASGVVGVWLALRGAGAWALVWQSLVLAIVKSGWLWWIGKWRPEFVFSKVSFRKIRSVGTGVFLSSLLNTVSLNIYNFAIGAWYSLASLGVYTQSDKWSKMGSASISQILTSSFLPLLSKVQDDHDTFKRYIKKINRFTAFIIYPVLFGMACLGDPIFHLLFADKWDAAIPLFQILSVRGIFIVLVALYSNYMLSRGYARRMFRAEVVKDLLLLAAILATIYFNNIVTLVWGQLVAGILTYIIILWMTAKAIDYPAPALLKDQLPFICATAIACIFTIGIIALMQFQTLPIRINALLQLIAGAIAGFGSYIAIMRFLRLPELQEAQYYILGRFRNSNQ